MSYVQNSRPACKHVAKAIRTYRLHGIMLWCVRGSREWTDDIKEWCKKDLYSLTISARDRQLWKQTMKFSFHTHGSWWIDDDE